MKNPFTLAALIALAATLFKENKDENTIFATEDGQLFFDENRAKLHAKSFEEKVKVHTITRTEVEGKTDTAKDKDGDDAAQEAKRQELLKEYEAVLGKKPNANTGIEKLQKAIDEKKAELAAGANNENK